VQHDDGRDVEAARPVVVLGVVVAPRLADDMSPELAERLAEDLGRRHPSVDWHPEVVVDRLVEPPASVGELLDAARRRLLQDDWDLGVVVTDLPLRHDGRPVSRRASRTHHIALVSAPALGPFHVRHRLRQTLVELVDELLGRGGERAADDVLRELTAENAERPRALRLLFVAAVLFSHIRLLLGMVRANRPWRLAARLYAALIAALAVGVYGAVTADIWRVSTAMSWWRLAIMSVVSIAVTIATVIVVPGLWERLPDPRVRGQVVLFNLATAATVTLGILSLYVVLFLLILGAAGLVATPRVFAAAVGHDVRLADYATLAWFVASLATIGGALGSALESDDAVRAAAYASSLPEQRLSDEAPAGRPARP
jgi:hypothetical protein